MSLYALLQIIYFQFSIHLHRPIVHACSPLSAKAPGYFSPQCQIYHRYTSPAGRSSLSQKKKKNGMRGPDFYFHYDCEENIWPFHQRQNRWLAKAHTYQLFLPVCVCYTELLWSVNCFYCFRGSTKKEDNIRLPNASNKQVKRRGFMKSLRKVSIGPG